MRESALRLIWLLWKLNVESSYKLATGIQVDRYIERIRGATKPKEKPNSGVITLIHLYMLLRKLDLPPEMGFTSILHIQEWVRKHEGGSNVKINKISS